MQGLNLALSENNRISEFFQRLDLVQTKRKAEFEKLQVRRSVTRQLSH